MPVGSLIRECWRSETSPEPCSSGELRCSVGGVRQTVLVAIEEYLCTRETAEILANPAAQRGLAAARESEQVGDVTYGVEAARALLAERKP